MSTIVKADTLNDQLQGSRLQSIDALRGMAALLIVFYHARPMFWVGITEVWHKYGLSFAPNAWFGYLTFPITWAGFAVHLFFVLSGYCIHRRHAKILATHRAAKINVKQFWLRRFWRIYPVYFASLLLTAAIDQVIRVNYPSFVESGWDHSISTFCVSLLGLQGLVSPYFGSNSTLWTLALEMHFYFLYPFLFYASKRVGGLKLLQLAFLVSLLYTGADWLINFSRFLPYERSGHPVLIPFLFTWVFGMYIADWEAGRVQRIKSLRLLSFLGLIVALPVGHWHREHLATLAITPALVLLVSWSIKHPGIKFWNRRISTVIARIGLFSYSVYAIHRPCLVLSQALLPGLRSYAETIWPSVFITSLCILLGWLFFICCERWTLIPLNQIIKNTGSKI